MIIFRGTRPVPGKAPDAVSGPHVTVVGAQRVVFGPVGLDDRMQGKAFTRLLTIEDSQGARLSIRLVAATRDALVHASETALAEKETRS